MTNNEYTPTTDDVRNDYRFSNKRPDVCGKDFGDEFDRWLDTTIRQAKAEALREAAAKIENYASATHLRFTEHVLAEAGAALVLNEYASRIEAGE